MVRFFSSPRFSIGRVDNTYSFYCNDINVARQAFFRRNTRFWRNSIRFSVVVLAKKPPTPEKMKKLESLRSRPRRRPDWSDMMKEVESGRKLKHVECNDRSAPIIPKTKSKGQVCFCFYHFRFSLVPFPTYAYIRCCSELSEIPFTIKT